MNREYLPTDSKRYSGRAFSAKEEWHHRRARMSFTRKIDMLDRLLEMSKTLPKLESDVAPTSRMR